MLLLEDYFFKFFQFQISQPNVKKIILIEKLKFMTTTTKFNKRKLRRFIQNNFVLGNNEI